MRGIHKVEFLGDSVSGSIRYFCFVFYVFFVVNESMSDIIITVENLSKRYKLGVIGAKGKDVRLWTLDFRPKRGLR